MSQEIIRYGSRGLSRTDERMLRHVAREARMVEAQVAIAAVKADAIVEVGEEIITGLSHLTDYARTTAGGDPTKQAINATILDDAVRHCRRLYNDFGREL